MVCVTEWNMSAYGNKADMLNALTNVRCRE